MYLGNETKRNETKRFPPLPSATTAVTAIGRRRIRPKIAARYVCKLLQHSTAQPPCPSRELGPAHVYVIWRRVQRASTLNLTRFFFIFLPKLKLRLVRNAMPFIVCDGLRPSWHLFRNDITYTCSLVRPSPFGQLPQSHLYEIIIGNKSSLPAYIKNQHLVDTQKHDDCNMSYIASLHHNSYHTDLKARMC